MPKVLGGSEGGGRFRMGEVPLFSAMGKLFFSIASMVHFGRLVVPRAEEFVRPYCGLLSSLELSYTKAWEK